ncbi:hypothetical protein QQ045_012493 [Rhodiola kirilowii]
MAIFKTSTGGARVRPSLFFNNPDVDVDDVDVISDSIPVTSCHSAHVVAIVGDGKRQDRPENESKDKESEVWEDHLEGYDVVPMSVSFNRERLRKVGGAEAARTLVVLAASMASAASAEVGAASMEATASAAIMGGDSSAADLVLFLIIL